MKYGIKQKNKGPASTRRLKSRRGGFTLLFASLIVSLLLAIGLAILHITLEQLLLSSVAKESQFAFYNADTGIECAMYHDRNSPSGKTFATSSDSSDNIKSSSDISCNGVNPMADPVVDDETCEYDNGLGLSCTVTRFDLVFDAPECQNVPNALPLIHVSVSKNVDQAGDVNTLIKSYGYNTCDPTNIRRVERGFQVNY